MPLQTKSGLLLILKILNYLNSLYLYCYSVTQTLSKNESIQNISMKNEFIS